MKTKQRNQNEIINKLSINKNKQKTNHIGNYQKKLLCPECKYSTTAIRKDKQGYTYCFKCGLIILKQTGSLENIVTDGFYIVSKDKTEEKTKHHI